MGIYDKLLRGQIMSVDPVRNLCTVLVSDALSEVECSLIYPFVSGNSGIRFMPKGGEYVLVSFSPIGVPRIVGFMLPSKQIEVYEAEKDRIFLRKLDPGDVCIYTGENVSEIFLSDKGQVEIGAGITSAQFDAVRRAIEFISGMIRWTLLSGVSLGAGYVIRNIAGMDQRFTGQVEFRVDVENATGKLASLKMGNVLDENGIPEIGDSGGMKLISLKSYLGIVPIGEIYFGAGGDVMIKGKTSVTVFAGVLNLGGVLAAYSSVRGEILVEIIQALIQQIVTALRVVDTSNPPVVEGVVASLQTLSGSLSSMLSPTVRII